jgi:RNA polymerase sigma-70 factor, ECF subfamily
LPAVRTNAEPKCSGQGICAECKSTLGLNEYMLTQKQSLSNRQNSVEIDPRNSWPAHPILGPHRDASEKVSRVNRTDAELIEAHRRGDATAVQVLVARHLARVRSLLFQLVLDRDEADELTQEVFVSVLRNLDGFRSDAAFGTWLHRIAVNAARQAARRARVRRSQIARAARDFNGETSVPERELIRNEQRDGVQQALGKLSLPLRSAVVLTVMQGLSAGEAAEIEGCPVGTIYWRVHEARRLLRDELKGLIE